MSETEDEEIDGRCVKITLVGEPLTGKSSICNRYLGGGGIGGGGSGSTQGAEVFAAQWTRTPLQLCDVAGAALYTTMLPNYLYDSDIVIFVYDLTNLQSFEKLDIWIKTVKNIFETETKKPLMALFGNKSDLEHQRAVRISCVQKFASEYILENFTGSARTGDMIFAVFSNLISHVLGIKIPVEVGQTKRRMECQVSHEINDQTTHSAQEATNLIMSRKVLRKVQRKSSSSTMKAGPKQLACQLLLMYDTNTIIIEKYTDNVRFCIICNYLGKIIPALQSRCTRFRFAPLHQSQIVPRLRDIVQNESVKISEDGINALLALSGGDMRKVLNTLQSTWLAYKDVTEDNVYSCVGHPLRSDINFILNCLLNENDFATCFKQIQDLKISKGLALGDILTEIHTIMQRVKFPPDVLITLLIKMADSEARLSSGCSERIELAALISAFQLCKDKINVECLAT